MTVLAAVDVEEDPARVIDTGYEFATAFEEPLVVVYVMPPGELSAHGTTQEQASSSAKNRVSDVILETLGTLEGVEIEGRVGEPTEEILGAIRDTDPRVVVVGGRKRSPVKQMLFGSVSQTVVREAERPVVTLLKEEKEE